MSIRELIHAGLINLELQAQDAESAVTELAGLLARDGAVADLDRYVTAVREREKHSTTGVGFGVAIPHGKSAAVRRAAVAFGRTRQGLEWNALDGQPVHLVFLIAAPEDADNVHLRALSHLARKLMDEGFREGLRTAATPEQVLSLLE
jgi:fructose-specific phosphotransferase system IIA component